METNLSDSLRSVRKLSVVLRASGDVEYEFHRIGGKVPLVRYKIDWPAVKVDVVEGGTSPVGDIRCSQAADGSAELEWARGAGVAVRGVRYVKRGFLVPIPGESGRWSYRERFGIKPELGIWINVRTDELRVLGGRATAVFEREAGAPLSLSPHELSERVFHEAGVLRVDWVVEMVGRT
jgi:hypothetical protein